LGAGHSTPALPKYQYPTRVPSYLDTYLYMPASGHSCRQSSCQNFCLAAIPELAIISLDAHNIEIKLSLLNMSDLNPSPPAPRLVSAGMVDEWSHLLPGPERSAFVEACTEAGADDSLQPILSRYFSTWKTNLMADDLSRLQMLATYVQIQDYVKVIWLEDDYNFEEETQSEFSVIWPRHKDGHVVAEALGVGLLKDMLVAKQLRPDRLEVRDMRSSYAPLDPEIAASLMHNILDSTDLAITALFLYKDWTAKTLIVAELLAEYQGQGKGFSTLRKADLWLNQNLYSYWAYQILFHAPALKELSLSFKKPRDNRDTLYTSPFILAWPALEKLELSMATITASNIMAILSKSEQSLTGISFCFCTLFESPWAELLNHISNKFPNLTWFKLQFIAEGNIGKFRVRFPDLVKDSVVSEPYKTGLKIRQTGPAGNKRTPNVEYSGPHANHVLRIVAECAVSRSLEGEEPRYTYCISCNR
jgi:hypothetical protein